MPTVESKEGIFAVEFLLRDERLEPFVRLAVRQLVAAADEECERQFRGLEGDWRCSLELLRARLDELFHQAEADVRAGTAEALLVSESEASEALFFTLLDYLSREGESPRLVRVEGGVRSRVFELLRYLKYLRQRMPGPSYEHAPRLTHMLKISTGQRFRPKRDAEGGQSLVDVVEDLLDDFRFMSFVEGFEALRERTLLDFIRETWALFAQRTRLETLARFQAASFKALVKSGLNRDDEALPAVIAADTGFGKTEAFLLPILFHAFCARLSWPDKPAGCSALLLYPRVDLANNQLERAVYYMHQLNEAAREVAEAGSEVAAPRLRIAIAHSRLDSARGWDDVPEFRLQCPECRVDEGGQTDSYVFLKVSEEVERLTCSRCSAHLAANDMIVRKLDSNARNFDVAVTTVDTLHRRLMDHQGAAALWKHPRPPRFVVLDEIHIYENQHGSHVAMLVRRLRRALSRLRGSEKENPAPPLFVGASATMANPRETAARYFGVRPFVLEERIFQPEPLGPEGTSPDMEPYGRDSIIFLKIPPNRSVPLTGDAEDGARRVVTEQATLIQAAFCLWHTMRKTPGKYRALCFVDSLDAVWRIGKNVHDAEQEKSLFRLRTPVGRQLWDGDRIRLPGPNAGCPSRRSGDCTMPPSSCQIYADGECWWTTLGDQATDDGSWDTPMRVQVHASGMRRDPSGGKVDRDAWDFLFTTSTLEVGFDHPELAATVQYLAPPSVASFFQRKGRAGRGQDDDPIMLVVLGNRQADQFYFHRHHRLSPKFLEAVRFDSQNPFVQRQHVLASLMDFLSWKGHAEECFHRCNLRSAVNYLREYRAELVAWVRDILTDPDAEAPQASWVEGEVEIALRRLEELAEPLVPDDGGNEVGILGRYDLAAMRPAEVFLQQASLLQQQKTDAEVALRTEPDPTRQKALRHILNVVQHALAFRDRQKGKFATHPWIYPVELMKECPIGDPGHVIPSSFTPVPLGGHCAIFDDNHALLDHEDKTLALAAFLPGGFKYRWNFANWMGVWKPSKSGGPWMDLSDSFGVNGDYEELGSLRVVSRERLPEKLRDLGIDPNAAICIVPRSLNVRRGRYGTDHSFYYNPTSRTFSQKKENQHSWKLTRDPLAAAQHVDVLAPSHDSEHLASHHLIGELSFHRPLNLVRMYFANVVTAFTHDQQPRGLVVRFREDLLNREVLPTASLRTEGVLAELRMSGEDLDELLRRVPAEAVEGLLQCRWFDQLWGRMLQGDNEAPARHPFEVESLWICLKMLDFAARVRRGARLEELSSTEVSTLLDEIRPALEAIGYPGLQADSREARLLRERWEVVLEEVLRPARRSLVTMLAKSLAWSLAATMRLMAAEATSTSPDLFVWYADAHATKGGWELLFGLYDNLEGGSGGARRFAWHLEKMDPRRLAEDVQAGARCPQHAADEFLLRELVGEQSERSEEGAALGAPTLEALGSTPSLRRFYQEVAVKYRETRDRLGRSIGAWELALELLDHHFQDKAARQLFETFLQKQGGVSELVPRLQEMLPVCEGTCPACLGVRREQGSWILPFDRRVVQTYLGTGL